MAQKHIYVGNEYKKAFEGICTLINGGCFSNLPYKVMGNVISDGTYEYELLDTATTENETVKHGFEKDGASWFKALRGQAVESSNAVWTSFIETVGIEYHKRFSVVEYEQKVKSLEEIQEAEKQASKIIKEFTRCFYPALFEKVDIRALNGDSVFEDIYGVSMRMELSGGTGASLPILSKVYFSKTDKALVPINGRLAVSVDESLKKIIPDEERRDNPTLAEAVIDSTMNALDKLIRDNTHNVAEFMCFSDESDESAVKGMLDKMSHDSVALECTRVDVLYITHVKASASAYDVYCANKPLFRLTLGINNALNIECLNCNEGNILVDRNAVTYVVDGKKKEVLLNPYEAGFGLTEEQIKEVIEYSSFKEHVMTISCNENVRNRGCSEHRCLSQVVAFENEDGTVYKCKYCSYPEMVYKRVDGERIYTPQAVFANDRLALVKKRADSVVQCRQCGRYFTVGAMKNHKECPLCYAASHKIEPETAKENYKKYKKFLSLGIRLGALFSTKYCYEDDELILFVVGDKCYAFNKLNAKEAGYIEKPRRIALF